MFFQMQKQLDFQLFRTGRAGLLGPAKVAHENLGCVIQFGGVDIYGPKQYHEYCFYF